MLVSRDRISELEQIYQSSINAGIARLRDIGTWPRPPAARKLNLGYDFYYDDIKGLPEANAFIERLADDGRIRSIYFGDPSNSQLHILYYYWIRLLLFILRETSGDLPSSIVLRKWFRRFLKELHSDTAIWRTVDTVTGLILNGKRLKLDEKTTITSIPGYRLDCIPGKSVTHWQSDVLFKHNWLPGGHDKATIITTTKILKHDYAGFYRPHPHLTNGLERALAVIEAIRLSKPGAPRLHYHAQFHISEFPLENPFSFRHSNGDFGLYEEETVIEKSDYKGIRELWFELMEMKYREPMSRYTKPTPLDVALGRFSKTYELQNWLDDIVDLTIALESLFGPEDNQELSHRISLRTAWLLGQDIAGNDPNWSSAGVYERVRTMYKLRSARVHGNIPKEKDICKWVAILSGVEYDGSKHLGASYGGLLTKATESARGIVRKAIRGCARLAKMASTGPHWPLPKDFDKLVLSSLERKKWQRAAGIRDKR